MMKKEILASGQDIQSAVVMAKQLLGATEMDDVEYEIVDTGSKGIFGLIGVRPAKVRAWIELPDEMPKRRTEQRKETQNTDFNKADKFDKKDSRQHGRKNRNDRSDRNDRNAPADFVAPAKKTVVKDSVIPEAELVLTPATVALGEDLAFDFVKQTVLNLGLEAEVALFYGSDDSRRIVISGKDASSLIGHHGDTLDSLQYLANLASTRKNISGERNRRRVTIDIEGYRAKREETLRQLARRTAEKALRNKRNVMLEPMSAYERRIIHSEIQGIEGVSTNSIGSDNHRKIVVYLTDKAQKATSDVKNNEEL